MSIHFQVLELVCTRESGSVFESGGLNCVHPFITTLRQDGATGRHAHNMRALAVHAAQT